MHKSLNAAIAVACVAWAAPVQAQDKPAAPMPENATQQAARDEIERQLYVGMVAIRDYCKGAQPERAKDIDASWAKETADVPAPLIEFSKTPNFTGLVAERIKLLQASNSNPEQAGQLKSACEKMQK